METSPAPTLNLTGVLSDSKRILRANYTHFLTLSLLFLPFSFSLIATPTLRLSAQLFTADHFHKLRPYHQSLPVSELLYILIAYVFTLCAIATVTYSSHNAFFGEPVNLFGALKSLTFSFFPLLSTAIIAHVLLIFITISFLLLVGSVLMLVQNLGLVVNYNSIYFMGFSGVLCAILLVIMIYFHVSWSLAFVVVVVESKWGFTPLMRSAYLVKGMRSVSLLLLLYFGVFGGVLVWVYDQNVDVYRSWAFVLITILGLFFLMMILVRSSAANTVLYNYCKALHGELAMEVAEPEGFGYGYINLPSDDQNQKVPQVVTITAAA